MQFHKQSCGINMWSTDLLFSVPDYPIFIVLSEIIYPYPVHKNESGHFVLFEDTVKHVFEEGPDSLMMDVLNGDSDGVFVVRFTVRHQISSIVYKCRTALFSCHNIRKFRKSSWDKCKSHWYKIIL